MLSNAHYLGNSGVELDGLRFWGSPITPVMESMGGSASRKVWDRIPDGTDVLITHGPPQSILDQEHIVGEHLGCTALLQAVLRVRPQVHVFGHTHGGHGEETGRHGTQFVNCSVFNAQRRLAHAATVVESGVRQRALLTTTAFVLTYPWRFESHPSRAAVLVSDLQRLFLG